MRKITEHAVRSFMEGDNFSERNTKVVCFPNGHREMYLHGNLIAQMDCNFIQIANAGYFTNVTKERLNGLPGVSISQRKGVWYLNGDPWDGKWITL
jgi:hypothetical protein